MWWAYTQGGLYSGGGLYSEVYGNNEHRHQSNDYYHKLIVFIINTNQ